MANRYWVGGTGSWSGTNTANWSDTSGGTGGFSVPTSADDVFFDANSGTGTATIATANMTVKSLNCTGYTGTLAGSASLTVAGSVTWGAGMTLSWTGTLLITATATLTSNGKSRSGNAALTINGAGITVTLADAFSLTGATGTLSVNNGTFDTAGYALTAGLITSISTSNTRRIYLRSSQVTLTGANLVTNITVGTNLTFDAGTSTVTLSSASAKTFGTTPATTGGSLTLNKVVNSGAGTLTLQNSHVFSEITVDNPTAASLRLINTDSNQTIGTLNLNGGAGNQRVKFASTVYQTQRSIALTSFGTSINCDFSDIAITGAAAGTSITRAGDHGGNSGITFPAPKTVYWNLAGTNGFAANGWAATSGGTPSVDNFPLAQDTAIVNNSSAGTGFTSYASTFTLGTLDMSSRTTAFSINFAAGDVQFAGSFKAGTGNTFTANADYIEFVGSGAAVLQSNGRTINHNVRVSCRPGGSVTLSDALTLGASRILTVASGSFDTAGYAVSMTTFFAGGNASTPAYLTLGTSTVTVAGNVSFTAAGLTFSGASSTINLSAPSPTFSGAGQAFGTVTTTSTSTGTMTVNGANSFVTLTSTRPVAFSILFAGSTTQTFTNFNVSGSAGALVTIGSTNTAQATLQKPSAWNVGANSVDGGNNVGLSFTGTNPDYLSISRITGQVSAGTLITATLVATDAQDTASASGSVTAGTGPTGALAATESQDVFAGAGKVAHVGSLAATESQDSATASGTVTNTTNGTLAATEAQDAFAGAGKPGRAGTLSATEAADAFAAVAVRGVMANMAAIEAQDSASASGFIAHTGALAATEEPDVVYADGFITHVGTLAATENGDYFNATGVRIGTYPSPEEVKFGVIYGPGGIYTGTMRSGTVWVRRR